MPAVMKGGGGGAGVWGAGLALPEDLMGFGMTGGGALESAA